MLFATKDYYNVQLGMRRQKSEDELYVNGLS